MKSIRYTILVFCLALLFSSCSTLFKPKYGCPSNGKNVGAEKLISDPSAGRKAKKFRA